VDLTSCLLDTNVLLRITRRADPEHSIAYAAVTRLAEAGTVLFYTHQNIAELWNVMTRPISRNGLGLTSVEAESEVQAIENGMSFLPENEATYREWRRLILLYDVSGVQVHDARLAATMLVHGLRSIVTFNTGDFNRYIGLAAMHPSTIAVSGPGILPG
jgi:predicted nucleic acid-binding protein